MGWYDFNGYGYRPYVPVAQRRANALREIAKRFKNGKKAAEELDYVALPDSLTKQIRERVWSQIK